MPRIESHKVTVRGRVSYRVVVPPSKENPRRAHRWFKSKEKADAFATQLNDDRAGRVEEVYAWSRQEQTLMAQAHRKAGCAQAVLAAVEAHQENIPRLQRTLGEAATAFIEDKHNSNRSKPYMGQIRWALNSFKFNRNDAPCASIAPDDIRKWVNARGSAATRQSCLQRLRTFFEFCRLQGWVKTNPAEAVTRPSSENKPPGILTVDECKSVLKACQENDKPLVTYFALCLFAGLRPAEARAIRAEDIRDGHIEVSAAKAKTRRRRFVTVNETLEAWLALGGEFEPKNWRSRFRAVVKASGVEWTNDCMRHSFVSYHYAIHGSSITAREAGHSEQILFANYRALVTTEEARKFWELRPNL
jgi:integrase